MSDFLASPTASPDEASPHEASPHVASPDAMEIRHINLADPADVAYWTKELGISPQALRAVVQMGGSRLSEVFRFLGR